MGASQSMLSRLENDVLGNEVGLKALDIALQRSTDALLLKQGKRRLILDVDSTEDPAHGSQENAACNGYFAANCFHPLFAFTSDSVWLGAKLRSGNVHLADGTLGFIHPIVKRYRSWFELLWLRGDSALASPDTYEYCEEKRSTYFIRLRAKGKLYEEVSPHMAQPVGRPNRKSTENSPIHLGAFLWGKITPRSQGHHLCIKLVMDVGSPYLISHLSYLISRKLPRITIS
jgi:hypothetical protein